MSYTFVNRPDVYQDLLDATQYYKQFNPELPIQFLFRVREAKVYIAKEPLGFQIKYNNVRTVLLKQFPYHIHYFIDESRKQIVILAIIHSYTAPKDYSNRK